MADREPSEPRPRRKVGSQTPVVQRVEAKLGKPVSVARGDAKAMMEAKLKELDFDPIVSMVELTKSKDIRDDTKAKLAMELAAYLVPKQKPVDDELERLKRQTAEAARYVILGEREDATSQEWEARNRHWLERVRVPVVAVAADEKVPEGVVPS